MSLFSKKTEPAQQLGNADDQQRVQGRTNTYFTRIPLAAEIPEKGFVVALISGTYYVYSKIGTQRYRVAMTAV